jgi:glycyl-tRNA synthetase beta chain
MPRLLFEIGTEELPAWYVASGAAALADALTARLSALRLDHGAVRTFATPRRLAVTVDDVAAHTALRAETRRGPAESAAFDADGRPTRAALGFAASAGVRPEELTVEETDKGRYVVARRAAGGEDARDVLPAALGALVAELPAPRKMRWGEIETPFVRPIAWLVALWDDAVLPVTVAGVEAGRASRGHRFLHPAPIDLPDAAAYADALLRADVVADRTERIAAVRAAVTEAAGTDGGTASAPEALVEEIVDLVERPFAVVGAIDPDYLELPDDVLTTVMIHYQRFVPIRDDGGRLLPRFVAVANHRVPDPALVRGGYERVLDGRLRDARFFWQADRRKSLSQHAWSLSGIAFQKELGSMADKVARVGSAAFAVAGLLGLTDEEQAVLERALPVFRADLATEMVGELPELEGTMARAYARAEGQPEAVAVALEDGILPRGPHDALPATRVGAVLAVADRLDKLLGFFALGKRPTGSADPYALRRDAVAVARVVAAQGWPVPLDELTRAAAAGFAGGRVTVDAGVVADVTAFVWDRAAALLAEEGLAVRTVRAATAGRRSLVAAARRAHLLHALSGQSAFAEMLALYKRAANLAERATSDAGPDPRRFQDPVEARLYEALPAAQRGVALLLEAMDERLPPWDLGRGPTGSLGGLDDLAADVLQLKAPLDAFFDGVMVMVDDDALRHNRLALLAAVAATPRGLGALEHLAG